MAEFVGRDCSGAAAAGGKEGGGEETGVAAVVMEGGESEQEDEEDVFEVESILDSKIEGGEVLYRVRWKGYDSDGDTWEPEAHLDDCKEVLLEFRRKQAENKQKQAKKEAPLPRLSPSDLFEAVSDSETVDDSSLKKKKKSREEDDEKLQKEKKKLKSGKSKEKTKPEGERSESPSSESKPKKRLSESKEDLSIKKPKKEDSKEPKKAKKEDFKDLKVKSKEEHKEKKHKRPSETEQGGKEGSSSQEPVSMSKNTDSLSEEKEKPVQDKDADEEMAPDPPEEAASGVPIAEEMDEMKLKKKKKKHKKKMDKDDGVRATPPDSPLEKKVLEKKQKLMEKTKESPVVEKPPTPAQKSSRQSSEDKTIRSVDSVVENKEGKKSELAKDKPRKKPDLEKDVKKETKVVKLSTPKEQKVACDAFTVSAEDREECMESTRKKEETAFEYRLPEEYKPKDMRPSLKERRSTQEETDSWTFGSSEGDQEVMDTVCHLQDNSGSLDSKSQIVGVGMDLQLEWMTLEDFQKHLDGSDEVIPKEPVSNNAFKEAVKNGDYVTVRYALNSKEEYNLEQEDSSGMTLVMMAAAAGQDDILRLLIKKGAKINARQKNGTTALIHAAEKNYLTTVALLLDAGAFVNVQQVNGETALMKACKRGNYDVMRILIEQGADCNILSKHLGNALQFAKQSNNVLLIELLNGHLEKLSRVVEDAIKDYFENRLELLESVFPIVCHRLCEGPDFSLDFNYKPPYNIPEESGILLFVFHANFFGKDVAVRLCGPCSVQAVVLNDKFQLPVFLDAHFIYSFSPVAGANKLFIRLSEVPTAKVKLLICAYRVQLH